MSEGLPVVTVEMAFGNDPGDAPYTWTDVTGDSEKRAAGLRYSRGRQNERGQMETGTGAVTFKDMVSAFDPDNASSDYYPDVVPMVPVRALLAILELSYRVHVLNDAPLAYWRLGETAGTAAVDELGYHDLLYSGATLNAADALTNDNNPAVSLTAATQHVSATDPSKFAFPGLAAFTFEAWVYPTTLDANARIVGSKWHTSPSDQGWALDINATNLRFRRGNAGTTTTLSYGHAGAIAVNNWYLVACSFDGANMRIYLNGSLVAGPTASAISIGSIAEVFRLGQRGNTTANSQWIGRVDEAAIYPVALTDARLLAHYNAGGGTFVDTGRSFPLFQHYVERWPRTQRISSVFTQRDIDTVDAFAIYAAANLESTHASLTTALAGTHNDLVWTAFAAGEEYNDWTVAYVSGGALNVTLLSGPKTIVVTFTATTTAQQVLEAGSSALDDTTTKIVEVTLAPGNDGTGIVATMAATHLAGGLFPAQHTGERIAAVLDLIGRPTALRDIDTGVTEIAADGFDVSENVRALTHMLEVADTEAGMLFVDGAGEDVFVDRHATLNTAAIATFADNPGGGEYRYVGLVPSYDVDHVVNDWSGTRAGGTSTLRVQDAASQARYLRRSGSMASLVTNDSELLYALNDRLAKTKDPVNRVDQIVVMPARDLDLWAVVAGLEVGDRITVKETPPGAPARAADYVIQRLDVDLQVALVASRFTFGLVPADTNTYWILGVPGYSEIGSTTRLAW